MMKNWFKKVASQKQVTSPKESAEQQPTASLEPTAAQDPAPERVAKTPEPIPDASPRFGLFKRLKERLGKTREGFVHQMDQLLLGRKDIDPELLDELEEILVTADMGVTTVQEIFDQLRAEVRRKELRDPKALRASLRQRILERLKAPAPPLSWEPRPFVVLVVGVNGVGKTTTIAKLAHRLQHEGRKVLLVAADTFRAAAIEQLEMWGQRTGVSVIKHRTGADPSAVVYDGLEAGQKRGADVVVIDTAGRLHTKVNLMEELKKIRRVISKKVPEGPHEVLLVLDATTGQNAISQAELFNEATGVTGIALTKLDGTAKGGIVVSIAHQMQIPIRFIGIGEKMEDLRPFDPEEFVDALFAEQ